MPIHRLQGMLGTLWILNFVLLGLLIAPMNNGTPLLISLGLWAVPTGLLIVLSLRHWRGMHDSGSKSNHAGHSTRRTLG